MTRILITTSRMPFALDAIRKLGRAGHRIFAADTFRTAPGSHSRYVEEAFVTPSPRYDTRGFIDALEHIVASRAIELLVPTFEEAFYIARHRERLARHAEVFTAPFDSLAVLHNKGRFLELARRVGLVVPRGRMVDGRGALVAATRAFERFFARPVYSRGGVLLYTNAGPLANVVSIRECNPTPDNPWLVQEYVPGLDICSFSLVHHGRVVAHSAYVHPNTIEHAGGIAFESIPEAGTLDAARRIAAATGYHGQLSLDFRRVEGERTLVLIECNPRATAGVYAMPESMFVEGVLAPTAETQVAPPGRTHKLSIALLRDMLRDWRKIPDDLRALFSPARDVYIDRRDPLPAVFMLLSYAHVIAFRRRHRDRHRRTDLMAGYFHDVLWNGNAIDELGAHVSDRAAS
jgi:hypothetical protein